MEKKKLIIESRRYREETLVVSTRVPKDMLRDVDAIAKETGRTRNEIVVMCLEYALREAKEIVD